MKKFAALVIIAVSLYIGLDMAKKSVSIGEKMSTRHQAALDIR